MKKIKIIIVFLCISLILLQVGCSKEQDLLEDALNLINVVEDTHPAFALEDISDNYEQGKLQFIDSITKNTTKNEFTYLVRKYLTLLQDGHTKIQRSTNKKFLDLDYYVLGEELFLLNGDGSLSQDKAIQIGGVSTNMIYKTVQTYFPAENEAASALNNNMWATNYEILKLADCDISNKFVDITIDQNGVISEKKIKFIKKDIYKSYKYSIEIESKIINDIFYIDMNICKDNEKLENQVIKLKEAIQNGITRIIIDVRDNPGGNSEACEKLLNAMDMSSPSYGIYVRYSEMVNKKYVTVPSEGFEQQDPDMTTAKRNENIELVILMNEKTFSSATMMATYVKDGGLGTVIGRPSSNAPSDYGDVAYYKLPNSRINLSISHKRFLRPDTEANQRILLPDIITEYNANILEIAIDYLSTK